MSRVVVPRMTGQCCQPTRFTATTTLFAAQRVGHFEAALALVRLGRGLPAQLELSSVRRVRLGGEFCLVQRPGTLGGLARRAAEAVLAVTRAYTVGDQQSAGRPAR